MNRTPVKINNQTPLFANAPKKSKGPEMGTPSDYKFCKQLFKDESRNRRHEKLNPLPIDRNVDKLSIKLIKTINTIRLHLPVDNHNLSKEKIKKVKETSTLELKHKIEKTIELINQRGVRKTSRAIQTLFWEEILLQSNQHQN